MLNSELNMNASGPRQPEKGVYEIVTAYSGRTEAAAFMITLDGSPYRQGRIEKGPDNHMGKELVAVIAAFFLVPAGSRVIVKSRLQYIREGFTKIIEHGVHCRSTSSPGPFEFLWDTFPIDFGGSFSISVGMATWEEHNRCKDLAAMPEERHEPFFPETWKFATHEDREVIDDPDDIFRD